MDTGVTRTPRTNVVIIMADDMGYSDLGRYGSEIETPHLDALAADGVAATQFYNTARCSPSRASLLTGLHPHQTGIGELVNDDGPGGYPGSLNDRCATLGETFAAADYRTFLVGKWHLCAEREQPSDTWPTRRGFQHVWGTLAGAGSYFQPTTLHDGETPIDWDDLPDGFHYTDAIGERAAAEITDTAEDDRPFFGYVAFTAPHWPLHATADDLAAQRGRYAEGWDVLRARRLERQRTLGISRAENTSDVRDPEVVAWSAAEDQEWQQRRMEAYAAQVHAMDRAVGTIMAALDGSGRRDDTMVIFLADNGGCAEELSAEPARALAFARERLIVPGHAPDGSPMIIGNDPSIVPGTPETYASYGRSWANLSNTPFRLYKRWVHEGGIATPLIVNWPNGGLDETALCHQPHQLTDLAPSVLEATGVTPLAYRRGVALPTLPGHSMLSAWRGLDTPPHRLYWEHVGNAAVRDGRWKLVREHPGDWELYDLETDRSERIDLSTAQPQRVAELAADWQRWADEVGALPREQVLAAQQRAGHQPA